jgi:hypothetical protein
MNETRKVIGIDFGSTQSSIAIMEIGSNIKPELLNVGGGRNGQTLPTILALDKNDDTLRAAGNDVRQRYKEVADSSCKLVSDFKRYLGSSPNSSDPPEIAELRRYSEKYAKTFLREMAKIVERRFNVAREELSPDDFATCVAYPASWSDDQVRLLKKLVKEAGFPVDPDRGVYSLPEPVAAVHALRMGEGLGFRFGDKPEHFMVVDFGGGTLDVCVIQTDILGRAPKIVSTAGDPELGGKEFDDIVEKLFFKENGEHCRRETLSRSERFELRDRIKEAKEAASDHFSKGEDHTHSFQLPSGQFELHLYRNQFLDIVKDAGIYDKIRTCIHEALDRAGLGTDQITKAVLTGGSSRWFFLKEIVAKEFALGGDRIFLTDTPFTDVATGCAVSIGLSDPAPKKDGIWVKFRLSEKERWSEAKCLLAPGRNDSREKTGVQYLCAIPKTHYLHSWRIHLSWWHGFEKDSLEPIGSEAVIDAFCRSNVPFASRFRNMNAALHGRPTDRLEDEYKVYLQYQEDAAGVCTYRFEIVNHAASVYDAVLRTKGETAASELPKGRRLVGMVIPGQRTYPGGPLGLGDRKMKEWTPTKNRSLGEKTDFSASPRRRIRLPWKKK